MFVSSYRTVGNSIEERSRTQMLTSLEQALGSSRERSRIDKLLTSLDKVSLLSPRIMSILNDTNNAQYAKLVKILPRIVEFYNNFVGDIGLDVMGQGRNRFAHDILFSKEYIERYFSPEFLLDLEGEDLEEELVFMERISNYITNSIDMRPALNLIERHSLRSPIAYFAYALHRSGLGQNDIANFFRTPTDEPQVIFPLLDNFRVSFNEMICTILSETKSSQALLDLCLDLHNRGTSGNFGAALMGLEPRNPFSFLEGSWNLFREILANESIDTVRTLIPCLSRLFYFPRGFSMFRNITQERKDALISDILNIVGSGEPRKLMAIISVPEQFSNFLKGVNFDLQALEAKFEQIPDDKLDLFCVALKELDFKSVNHLLNGKYFSFQEILNLPKPVFLSAMKLLNTLYKYDDLSEPNRPLPESIKKFLIYDYNNQTPGYQANFNQNLERLNDAVPNILDTSSVYRIKDLADFDDCLKGLGLCIEDILNIRSTQPEKFKFLIDFIERLFFYDSQITRENFIKDYIFLCSKFIKNEFGKEYSFAEAMNNEDIGAAGLLEFKIPFLCLKKIQSCFHGIQELKGEELEDTNNQELSDDLVVEKQARRNKAIEANRLLQLKILKELSTVPPLVQIIIANYDNDSRNHEGSIFMARDSIQYNIYEICKIYFPRFTEMQKQIGYGLDMLLILKELNRSLDLPFGEDDKTLLDRIVEIRLSSNSLFGFHRNLRQPLLLKSFQEICSPKIPTFTLLDEIKSSLQPLAKRRSVFALITPQLLFTGKCRIALDKLKNALEINNEKTVLQRSGAALLHEFILRFEQRDIKGSAADFIRTIVTNPECLDAIISEIIRYTSGSNPINDGAKDLYTSLGLSEKDIIFTRLEGIHNSFVTPSSIQDALRGIASAGSFWTKGIGVGGRAGYNNKEIDDKSYINSLVILLNHKLYDPQEGQLHNPHKARVSPESNSAAYGFLFILSQQHIIDRLNDLKQQDDKAPYNELLQALIRFVKRFEPIESKPAGEPAMFWRLAMQNLAADAQIAKLVELSMTEVAAEAGAKTEIMSQELDLDRTELWGNQSIVGQLSK